MIILLPEKQDISIITIFHDRSLIVEIFHRELVTRNNGIIEAIPV